MLSHATLADSRSLLPFLGFEGDGETCTPICSAGCVRGTCAFVAGPPFGRCDCEEGFQGTNCSSCILGAHGCHENAACAVSPQGQLSCICNEGYEGNGQSSCQPVCTQSCGEHGVCTAPDTCSCDVGYTGEFCDTLCGCNGHSTCVDGVGLCDACQHNTTGATCDACADGFYGNATTGDAQACQPCPCNGHGTCNRTTGECFCDAATQGANCEECRAGFYGDPQDGQPCVAFCSDNRNRVALTEPAGWIGSGPAGPCNQGSGSARDCYRASTSCAFSIVPARAHQRVRLEFSQFETECGYDYVTLFDGLDSYAPAFGAISGPDAPPAVVSSQNTGLHVHWFSDVTWVLSGFVARYVVEDCPYNCGGHGACNTSTGVCLCDAGWAGAACAQEICPQNCSAALGRGRCAGDGSGCVCQPGFDGPGCQHVVSEPGFYSVGRGHVEAVLPPRADHAAAAIVYRGHDAVLVFGGRRSGPVDMLRDGPLGPERNRQGAFLNDVAIIETVSGATTLLKPPSEDAGALWPAGRHGHSLVSPTNSTVLLWGGKLQDTSISNELFRFDVSLQQWSRLATDNPPAGRYDHQAVLHDGMMYIIGGLTVEDGFAEGIVRLVVATMTWEVRTRGGG